MKIVFGRALDLQRDGSDAVDDLFQEDLQHRVRARVLSAQFSRLLDQVIVLDLTLVLVDLCWLVGAAGLSWWARLANETIDIVHDVVYVVVELLREADKLLG